MSEYMSNKMSDRMPDRLSEYMSDRMSVGGDHLKKALFFGVVFFIFS